MQQQIDPRIYDELLSSGQESAGLDPQIAMQQAMAKRLYAQSGAPAGAYSSGRRAVAPNPLEYVSGLANQVVGQNRDQQGMQLQLQQQAIHAQQVQKVLEALKAQRAMQSASQSVPQYAPVDNRADMMPGQTGQMGPQGGY